ncbi:coenzyme F420-0:L-glutamate ligase [Anaerolentibacter hominis]|uniref:coenzyme F420-0:L-glutamate ligase n=1 Tax=Anaerolentibacter hominis TaxID=3079009 RepID=UPI0031B80937
MIVNQGKSEFVEYKNEKYACYALRTKVVTNQDRLEDIVQEYALPYLQPGDILFISEKMAACTQGKAIPMSDIRPSRLACFLSRHVTRSSHGIGLSMPETMQCALNECGTMRILFSSAVSLIGKFFGQKGWFYRVAGYKAAGMDGPCSYTLPPYNHYVVPAPDKPGKVAADLARSLNQTAVLIVDINDLGGAILGSSEPRHSNKKYEQLLRQNPLGQENQQTPMGILRPVK